MKSLFALIALTTLVVLAHSQILGGVKDEDPNTNDREVHALLDKIVQFVNIKAPHLSASSHNVQLLKRTSQVVNGLKRTYTFKIPTSNDSAFLYYAEIWHAPWMNAVNKVVKACVLDLSSSSQSCSSGNECRSLALQAGTCF